MKERLMNSELKMTFMEAVTVRNGLSFVCGH